MTQRNLVLALLLIPLCIAAVSASQQEMPFVPLPGPPAVVTSGEATIRMAPDRGFVMITAQSRARQPKEAVKRNAEAMDAVQRKLKEAGIPADAIRTLSFDVQPDFEYVEGRQNIRGYVATNTIEVRVDSVDRVGEVIDLAVGSGATSVSGVRFDLKNRDAVEREALKQAVADARARADAAAAGAGRSIDRVLRIEEARVSMPPPRPMLMTMRAEAAEPQTPITPGQIEVRSQVTLTAALK